MFSISDIATLLRRPVAPHAPASPAAKRKPEPVLPAEPPLTEGELLAALQDALVIRAAAETVIATTAETRRKLLEVDFADESAIEEVDREQNRAQIRLERVDAYERSLAEKLREVRAINRADLFIIERDALVKAARDVLPILRDAATANATWCATLNRFATLFPDALNVSPGVIGLTIEDVARFSADVDKFAGMQRQAGRRQMVSAADAIADAIKAGGSPMHPTDPFAADVAAAMGKDAPVVVQVSYTAKSGQLVRAGTELKIPYGEAVSLVQRGYVSWQKESKA